MAACIGGTGLYKQLNQEIQKGLIYNSMNKSKRQKLRNNYPRYMYYLNY